MSAPKTDTRSELCLLTASELAQRIATKQISCREVIEAHIARIESINPSINAVVTTVFDQALSRASELDNGANIVGPLHGVPVLHKDLVPTRGIRTTFGSTLHANHVPDFDQLIVERMRNAGAITLGKTNTPEFGAGSHTFNRVFGITRNPYDLSVSSGGSSGGAAAALAARMIPLADGSDNGGSLRNPAAFCNVVGFRPSPGRIPFYPARNPWSDLSTEGPMARTTVDIALLFSVLAGPDPRLPGLLETEGSEFRHVKSIPLENLKIGFTEDFGGLPVEKPIRKTLRGFARDLETAGAAVEEATPNFRDASRIFHILRASTFRRFRQLRKDRFVQLKDTIRWNVEAGEALTHEDLDWVGPARASLIERMNEFFERFDLLIGPTTQVLPFDVNKEWVQKVDGVSMSNYIEWMEACSWITVSCCPALSLPAGFAEGLPVGAQLIAPMRQDAFLLAAAHAIEAATGHAHVLPSAFT
ncbi:MAG: amidase family protein [Pseudomonadales bacterium]